MIAYLSEESARGKLPSVAAVEVLEPGADDIAKNLRVPCKDLQHGDQSKRENGVNSALTHRFHPKEFHACRVCARLVEQIIKNEPRIVFHKSRGKSKGQAKRR